MNKRRLVTVVLIISLITAFVIPTQAFGKIVFDPTNFIENLESALQSAKQNTQLAEQIRNQIKSLQNEALNLESMDQGLSVSLRSDLSRSMMDMITCIERSKGLAYNFKNMQDQWDANYTKFDDYNGMSAAQYGQDAAKLIRKTSNGIYDAMKNQGFVAEIGNDHKNLQTLLSASHSARGALAALQACNEIGALQVKQMFRLQQIMATSSRAEAMYYQKQLQEEGMAQAESGRHSYDVKKRKVGNSAPDAFDR
jgi:P-type conjugative transfer protein TrbJ